jgi:hypothetical protein
MRGARHLACARHCPRFESEVSGAGRPEGPDLGRTRGRPRACVPRRGRTYVQLPRFVRSFFNVVVPVRSARSPIGNAAVCQKEREIYRPASTAEEERPDGQWTAEWVAVAQACDTCCNGKMHRSNPSVPSSFLPDDAHPMFPTVFQRRSACACVIHLPPPPYLLRSLSLPYACACRHPPDLLAFLLLAGVNVYIYTRASRASESQNYY